MEQYISKSALVAGIERNIKNIYAGREYIGIPDDESYIVKGLIIAKGIIDTLEVKEVDLEKEIEEHVVGMPMSEFTHEGEVDEHWDWARKEFRHFFELGMAVGNKAQKGE